MTYLSRLAMVLLVAVSAAAAQDDESERQSLKGLKGVNVLVEDLKAEAERDGLKQTSIQTDVELKLRQAGIAVLTKAEAPAAPGAPCLYISVSTSQSGSLYGFSIKVELKQNVRLDRDPSMWLPGVTTWSVDAVGTVGREKLRNLRDGIKDYVDRFINAYLSVNPKR
jgi:hypothetical protein